MFSCEFCQTVFSKKGNLNQHQKTAKYCLELQEKENNELQCQFCNKKLSSKVRLNNHLEICSLRQDIKNENKDNLIQKLENNNKILSEKQQEYEKKILILEKENEIYKEKLEKLENTIIGIAELNNEFYNNQPIDKQIQELTKKYGKKKPRQQVLEPNVIYILTTDSLKKERRYIFGKSKNLTTRLSTYNKTDEHEIIYHQACGNESNMDIIEKLVLHNLEEYREISNRDRFILPEDKDVDFFIGIIKKNIEFILKNKET